jgi:hypothetical protein
VEEAATQPPRTWGNDDDRTLPARLQEGTDVPYQRGERSLRAGSRNEVLVNQLSKGDGHISRLHYPVPNSP